jgi:putative transcriptional regulator
MMALFDSDLRRFREEAGLSQEALARRVGVSRQTIVNIEQGRHEPSVFVAMTIAAAVGVAVGLIDQIFRKGYF